jgi:DNA replication protein DnaC
MFYHKDKKFWEMGDYKDAHLSKLDLPDHISEKINNWWKNPQRFLLFLGNPGCGKSYLIASIINSIYEKNDNLKNQFRYFHEKDFFKIMRETIGKNWDYEYEIKSICETFLIFMDDIHSAQTTEFQKEALFNFLDQRSISGYPTVITSNLFLDQLSKAYEPRFVSRLKDKRNVIIELNWKDKRQE